MPNDSERFDNVARPDRVAGAKIPKETAMDQKIESTTTDTPKTGDRAVCQACGRPIEFNGQVWSHKVDGSDELRHPARPRK